jgi:four helix bundle protein
MSNIRSFKELRVWQNAMDTAMLVYEISKRFPSEERYSLTDQFRRASRSVAANIAEAWRKRRYPAAFVSKLSDAEGEAAEAQTWVEFARRCEFIKPDEAHDLDERFERILGQLVRMIEKPNDWVVGANRTRRVSASPRPRVRKSDGE